MLLKKGMSGPEVQNLENVIAGLGFEGVVMDGMFNEKLENVIKYIQKAHGLDIDGKVGKQTLELLDKLYEPTKNNFGHSPNVPAVEPEIASEHRLLKKVHPILARKVEQIILLAKKEGHTLVVTQGLRTFEEQNSLFKKRPKVTNARGGQSYHNYGLAVDLAFVVNGKISWDERHYKNIGRWANQVGLTWGGNWKFVDYPHVQLANLPATKFLFDVYNRNPNNSILAVWNRFVGV